MRPKTGRVGADPLARPKVKALSDALGLPRERLIGWASTAALFASHPVTE